MSAIARYNVPTSAVWQPFSPFFGLKNELDRLFENEFANFTSGGELLRTWNPAVDVLEDKDTVTVKAELPGFNKEDIDVSLDKGVLTISGERKSEKQHDQVRGHRVERFSGSFRRSVTLPVQVNAGKVGAQYRDGVLTVTLPKSDEAKRKQIEIKVN